MEKREKKESNTAQATVKIITKEKKMEYNKIQ